MFSLASATLLLIAEEHNGQVPQLVRGGGGEGRIAILDVTIDEELELGRGSLFRA